MRQKVFMFIISFILISCFSAFGLQFSTYEEEALYKKDGYQLQIDRAQHYINYALLQGLSESDSSIIKANEIIAKSQAFLTQVETEIEEAIKKDEEEKKLKEEEDLQNKKEELLEDIALADENYKKLMSILDVLELERIEDIPIDFIKAMGLFNYTYELLKNENVELTEQWIEVEAEMAKESLFDELEDAWFHGYITSEEVIAILVENGIAPEECDFIKNIETEDEILITE